MSGKQPTDKGKDEHSHWGGEKAFRMGLNRAASSQMDMAVIPYNSSRGVGMGEYKKEKGWKTLRGGVIRRRKRVRGYRG